MKASVKNIGWGRGSDCEPNNSAGPVNGNVTFSFSTKGIRLQSYIATEQDLGWEYTNESNIFLRKFSKKERADLLNPRKGVLTFTLSHHAAGNPETDDGFGTCAAWGDDGSCTWAHSWGVKIILVRADPMDLVYGP